MLDFFMQVQESAGGGGGGGDAFNADGVPPTTPTHLLMQPNGNFSSSGFMIWDVSNPASPSLSTTYRVGNNKYSADPTNNIYPYRRTLCVKNNVAYFHATPSGTGRVYAMDVSNTSSLSASSELGYIQTNARLLVAAHPTKDVLWTIHEDRYVRTWDISNPASITLIGEALSADTTNARCACISHDGEYLWRNTGSTLERWELNASNEPSSVRVETVSSWSTSTLMSLTYAEGVSGSAYLLGSVYNLDYQQFAELDSSFNVVDHWQVTSTSRFDDNRWQISMPYGSNYTSDDLHFAAYSSDDYLISITSSNPASSNTVTHRSVAQHITYISQGASSFDAYDQYIFSLYGDGQNFGVFEWRAINTTVRIAGFTPATSPAVSEAVSKCVLYAP